VAATGAAALVGADGVSIAKRRRQNDQPLIHQQALVVPTIFSPIFMLIVFCGKITLEKDTLTLLSTDF